MSASRLITRCVPKCAHVASCHDTEVARYLGEIWLITPVTHSTNLSKPLTSKAWILLEKTQQEHTGRKGGGAYLCVRQMGQSVWSRPSTTSRRVSKTKSSSARARCRQRQASGESLVHLVTVSPIGVDYERKHIPHTMILLHYCLRQFCSPVTRLPVGIPWRRIGPQPVSPAPSQSTLVQTSLCLTPLRVYGTHWPKYVRIKDPISICRNRYCPEYRIL